MQINIIAIGKKMPPWVEIGYQEYAVRLPYECRLNLIEIDARKRYKHADVQKILQEEGQQLLHACGKHDHLIALDRKGKSVDTHLLAKQLQNWQNQSESSISILIGGPEGLSEQCLKTVNQIWSLSKLTLPHPLVRILIAEQLYRAWSILMNHPYHR